MKSGANWFIGKYEHLLSVDYLRELLDFNPETGVLTWRVKRNNKCPAGTVAGCKNGEYTGLSINNRTYQAHRIGWAIYYGEFPPESVDHINRDKNDNRIANLRLATLSQNCANRRSKLGASSRFKGVFWSKVQGKWGYSVWKNGRCVFSGFSDTEEGARDAYLRKARDTHGEFVFSDIDQLRKLDAPIHDKELV